MNISSDPSQLYPLKFRPIYAERIWGGTMMENVLHRKLPPHTAPIGESWELADRDGAVSVVDGGAFDGMTIQELLNTFGSFLVGRDGAHFKRFPLLVKLIDAGERLSLQVHPDDNACRILGNGAESKTEMWYVIAAQPGAKILAGLQSRATRLKLSSLLNSPEIESQLQIYPSMPCDAYYIPSGTLHAIGAGNLLLEIQQNSDTTYRISDWGRVGADGKPRQLHVDEGMKSIDFTNRTNPRIAGAVGATRFNRKFDVVTLCPYFHVYDLRLNSVWNDTTAPGTSFHLLTAVRGSVEIASPKGKNVANQGETILVPASFGAYHITPGSGGESIVVKTTL